MSFFKDAIKKIQDLRPVNDDEDDIFEEEEQEDEDESYVSERASASADSIFGEDTPSEDDWFKYSPTSALENSGMNTSLPFTAAPPVAPAYSEKPKAVQTPTAAPTAKLFDISSARKSKFKLSFITLQDMYDAKNVANLMMENDTIVVVNIDNLSLRDKRRAMDFLDGAKYVAKSVHVQFTKTMYAYIPDDIELHGDFCDQVEISSFDDTQF